MVQRIHESRASADRERKMGGVVLAFFADLAARKLDSAKERTAPGFSWFGKVLEREDWHGEKLAAFLESGQLRATNAREVPEAIIETWLSEDADAIFGGALAEGDAVMLVDVERRARTVTAGVVLEADGDLSIRRVFDPGALKEALASLST